MRLTVLNNIQLRFQSLLDIVESLEPSLLTQQLEVPKSKSIGEHMWCLVGARESYSRALLVGQWDGFSCSLESDENLADINDALKSSQVMFEQVIEGVQTWTQERDELLVRLLEHETMHEGQLIRHVFALGHTLPDSTKWA